MHTILHPHLELLKCGLRQVPDLSFRQTSTTGSRIADNLFFLRVLNPLKMARRILISMPANLMQSMTF
jgi:hypothetical protein